MDKPTNRYKVPIWLSNWTFKDNKNKIYKFFKEAHKKSIDENLNHHLF